MAHGFLSGDTTLIGGEPPLAQQESEQPDMTKMLIMFIQTALQFLAKSTGEDGERRRRLEEEENA